MSTFDPWDNTFKSGVELAGFAVTILEFNNDVSRKTVQHNLLRLGRKFVPRLVEVDLVICCNRFEDSKEETGCRTFPWSDRTSA